MSKDQGPPRTCPCLHAPSPTCGVESSSATALVSDRGGRGRGGGLRRRRRSCRRSSGTPGRPVSELWRRCGQRKPRTLQGTPGRHASPEGSRNWTFLSPFVGAEWGNAGTKRGAGAGLSGEGAVTPFPAAGGSGAKAVWIPSTLELWPTFCSREEGAVNSRCTCRVWSHVCGTKSLNWGCRVGGSTSLSFSQMRPNRHRGKAVVSQSAMNRSSHFCAEAV